MTIFRFNSYIYKQGGYNVKWSLFIFSYIGGGVCLFFVGRHRMVGDGLKRFLPYTYYYCLLQHIYSPAWGVHIMFKS
jgi:hypothetical protein